MDRRNAIGLGAVAGLVIAALIGGTVLLRSDRDAPERVTLAEADVLRVVCGIHDEQRDLSGYELASEDDERPLWDAEVALSYRLSSEIIEALDRADFAVRELDVGNEPTEENVEAGRAVLDEKCQDVDAIEPGGAVLARLGCLMVEEFRAVPDSDSYPPFTTLFEAAATFDPEYDDLVAAGQAVKDNEVGSSIDQLEPGTSELIDVVADRCAE